MMRRYLHILMILMMGALSACSNTTAQPDDTQPQGPAETEAAPAENEDVRVLVAYFTYAENADLPEDVDASTSASIQPGDALTGNTGLVAAMIADELDADLFSIQTQERYPDTYDETIAQGQQEQQEAARPALRSQVEDMASYDVVFLGYPNWWGDMPMALYSFLDEYDLSGKQIIPFVTSGGSGFSNTVAAIVQLEPQAQIIEGLALSDSEAPQAQARVQEWLGTLELSAG